jgi:hypothetical protein
MNYAGNNSPSNISDKSSIYGRRFHNYTEKDFLEAYLGKDYAMHPDIMANDYNHTFGF